MAENEISVNTEQQEQQEHHQREESRGGKIWKGLTTLGSSILFGMEYVGEIVADVLGLDDSKFQDVIDNMTEEDWRVAIEIERERRLEDTIREVLEEESQKFAKLQSQSVEEGEVSHHAVYSSSSLPSQPASSIDPECADVTEFQILTPTEPIEPSYRPDGGFGYLSPEEVKTIKERVTAEFFLREEHNQNPRPIIPIPEVMIRDGNDVNYENEETNTVTDSQTTQTYSSVDIEGVQLEEINNSTPSSY